MGTEKGRWREMSRVMLFPLILAWLAAACAPSPGGTGAGSVPQAEPPTPARALVTAIRVEPKTIAARGLGQNTGVALYLPKRMFNADLALLDDQGNPQPYLAAALPALGSDTSCGTVIRKVRDRCQASARSAFCSTCRAP